MWHFFISRKSPKTSYLDNYWVTNQKLSGFEHGAPPPAQSAREPEVVCHSIFETRCEASEEGVTTCGQEERRICAEENCVLVEGEEKVDMNN